jgi:shikimate dehydrogenase
MRLPDGRWLGDNTDGPGLVRDLTERHALDLRGRAACCSAPAARRAQPPSRCSMPVSAS